jgi:uncharacterized zinc-type alcohol dehydrogenase-like protein
MKILGYATHAADAPLGPFEFDRRQPLDDDVQIAIDYCGICHSDLHAARNEWQTTLYPCVPGHEIVGRVTAVGGKVKKFAVGDRVGVGCFINSCGHCDSCTDGLEGYCVTGATLTYGSLEPGTTVPTFGGYSTHIVVTEDFVLRLPPELDAASAAPLLCAGITTYSPIRHVGLSKGDRIAVVGLGGLGHMAVKLAVSMGADVTVFSRLASKRADACRLGAA